MKKLKIIGIYGACFFGIYALNEFNLLDKPYIYITLCSILILICSLITSVVLKKK